MRILIASDAFPPRCGGSGWSTYELARGLRRRGHQIRVVQPRPGQASSGTRDYDGFPIDEVASAAPPIPFLRNVFKNERLWARLAVDLAAASRAMGADIIHAQHVLTSPAAVAAGQAVGIPVVCTVRDYWPVCYWTTLIHDPRSATLCPSCSAGMMTRCLRPRAGAGWPAALPFIPYMRGNLRRKQTWLARASAIVAVSSTIARDLAARSDRLRGARIEVVPNPVDVAGVRGAAHATTSRLAQPYAVFVGKLEVNKGAAFLLPAIERARLPWPLVVVGDGSLRGQIESEARRLGRDVRVTGWLARDEALAWLAHASMLVFPSYGPESLSRVLLESAALGVPMAAMHTGGTADIVRHDQTGLLSASPDQLGDHVARLVADRDLAARLAAGARAWIDEHFEAAVVVARLEALYGELIERSASHA
ncbi:MAG: glycosyltransferase family 4 protein [Acidobacteriota bacterium]